MKRANAYDLLALVSTPTGGPLHFTSLYYPAWQATLADGTELPTHPSTNQGLLTVDLPPGTHELYLRWAGTRIQHVAMWISLAALLGLTILTLRVNRVRWLAALPLGLLAIGLVTTLARPAMANIQDPVQPINSESLDLVGYRVEPGDARELYVYPYWYARQNPSVATSVRWQLRDAQGRVVGDVTSLPYFDSQGANNWPPGTLVDDAYQLVLPYPSGEPPYSYQLFVQVMEGEHTTGWREVGVVKVESPPPSPARFPQIPAVRFGGLIDLLGFKLRQGIRPVDDKGLRPTVVQPGDRLQYTLYWRAPQPLLNDYHGFIHLLDHQQEAIAKRDRMVGAWLHGTSLWSTGTPEPDRYAMHISKDTPTGLYWPVVGLYEFETLDLLPVEDASGQPLGDIYRLPPIKVLGENPTAKPQHEVSAELGDLATLLGYDLAVPETGVRPGSQISVTLYYRVNAATEQDLTQFVQLYSAELGMAAQRDAPPQQGANPTWAWVPGEVVVDTHILQVRDDAAPGDYQLLVGLYDPRDGARLPVRDQDGNTLPDGQVVLRQLTVSR